MLICGQKTKTVTTDGATIDAEPGFTEIGEVGLTGSRQFVVWNYVQQTTASNIVADAWTFTGTTESQTTRKFTIALGVSGRWRHSVSSNWN